MEGSAYHTLGVSPDADATALKKRYHQIAREWHPDISNHSDASSVFAHVAESYKILSDPQQRMLYDFVLSNDIPVSSPSSFAAFYARASRAQMLIRHRHQVGWAITGAIGMLAIGIRCTSLKWPHTSTQEGRSRVSDAPAIAGLLGAAGSAASMMALKLHGGTGARFMVMAAAGGMFGGQTMMAWLEHQVGEMRLLRSVTARAAADNARQISELVGGVMAVLLLRQSLPSLHWAEAHLRAMRAAAFGVVAGHGIHRLCGRNSGKTD